MNVKSLIRQRKKAINEYDYAEAERLDREILSAFKSPKGKKRQFLSQSEVYQIIKSRVQKLEERKEFLIQYYEVQEQNVNLEYSQLLESYSKKYQNSMLREEERSIPEVIQLLHQSKHFASIRKYEIAENLYDEAKEVENQIIIERKVKCYRAFKHIANRLAIQFDQQKEILQRDLSNKLLKIRRQQKSLIDKIHIYFPSQNKNSSQILDDMLISYSD